MPESGRIVIDTGPILALVAGVGSLDFLSQSLARGIPSNALIVFDVVGEPAFNKWHHETSMRNREPGQPILQVHVGKLRTHSAIEDVHLTLVLA